LDGLAAALAPPVLALAFLSMLWQLVIGALKGGPD
jgi:hypothetical protein